MNAPREFRPESIPRRGEWTAWTLTIIAVAAGLVLRAQVEKIPVTAVIFILFFLFSALSISLSHWIDHITVLTLKPEGVDFRNGLRNVTLKWDAIQEIRVFPSRFGAKAHIIGLEAHFNFRTMSEVTYKGETRGYMGFAQGEFIIQQILKNSALQEIALVDQTDQTRYYARP